MAQNRTLTKPTAAGEVRKVIGPNVTRRIDGEQPMSGGNDFSNGYTRRGNAGTVPTRTPLGRGEGGNY